MFGSRSHCCIVYLQEWTATADFTHHAHTASVSAVATSERYIATGSRDETIQIYDMKKRVEHGALLHHDGKRDDMKKRVEHGTLLRQGCIH